jgi:hypothetical protein
MTSYLVEAVLFAALVVTAWRVTKMHCELKKLRNHETEFAEAMTRMNDAFDNISLTVHELNATGTTLVHLLGVKIDEARGVMAELDRRRGERVVRAVESVNRNGERTCIPFAAIGQSSK